MTGTHEMARLDALRLLKDRDMSADQMVADAKILVDFLQEKDARLVVARELYREIMHDHGKRVAVEYGSRIQVNVDDMRRLASLLRLDEQ